MELLTWLIGWLLAALVGLVPGPLTLLGG